MEKIENHAFSNHGTPAKTQAGAHSILVRAAAMDDAAKIFEVVSESMEIYRVQSGIPEGVLESGAETCEDIRSAISCVPVYVAVDVDGHIVGSVRLHTKKVSSFGIIDLSEKLAQKNDADIAYFCRFAVHEDRQGLGIGRLLYKAAEEKARDMNASHILLHTSLSNQIMVSFYKRRGFFVLHEDPSRGYPRGLLGKKLA